MSEKTTESYALLEALNAAGNAGSVENPAQWRVSMARPEPGSKTVRILSQRASFEPADVEKAVKTFFDMMRNESLPGVLDTAEFRGFSDTPLAFTELLTEEISDDIPEIGEEDARDDDFDNHPLSELREAMVDVCPEYSGITPDDDIEP